MNLYCVAIKSRLEITMNRINRKASGYNIDIIRFPNAQPVKVPNVIAVIRVYAPSHITYSIYLRSDLKYS